MIAEIMPHIKTPKSINAFDYQIPENLQIEVGNIVEIEFRKTKIIGLVSKIKNYSQFSKLKPILKKIDNFSFSKNDLKLLTWMTEYYFISPALAFKTMLPEIPKNKRELKKIEIFSEKISVNKNRLPEIKNAIKKIKSSKNSVLLHYSNPSEKIAVLSGLMQNLKKQALIIEPEISEVYNLANANNNLDIGLIHSGLNKTQLFSEWKKFKNNNRDILIGTKKAIFFPTDNLEYLIIDDEDNNSHKNFDQNPRYHIRVLAEQIHKFNPNIKLIFTSQSPCLSVWEKYSKIELLEKINPAPVIDMNIEKNTGNYSYFSEKLIENIYNSKKSFLLFNRKGEFKQLICQNCKNIIKLDENVSACPKCKSLNLKKSIFGITKLINELNEIFPDKKIFEISKEQHQAIPDNAEIILGTDFALNFLDINDFDFIGAISFDHELAVPNFLSSQTVFQKIIHLINYKKPILIQTHSPANPAINFAANLKFNDFYKQESSARKLLKYPPYGDLIKIINKKTKTEEIIKNQNQLSNIKNIDSYIIDRM